jgi:hypothetical protein
MIMQSIILAMVKLTRLSSSFAAVILCMLQLACHRTTPVVQMSQATAPLPKGPDLVLGPGSVNFKFIVYGDIRFTEPGPVTESKVSNRAVRDSIVDAITKEKAAFVAITGDIPWRGADGEDWKVYDAEAKPLIDAHTLLLPTIGNHEYLNRFLRDDRVAGLTNYFARFPQIPHRIASPWYSARYGNCYFLFLNSEDSDGPGSEQFRWMESQLTSVPSDIDYLFVLIHRPPYTASTSSTHRPRASEVAIARELELHQKENARPRIMMIAGHVHNYERYQHNGVTYIVSGGGGAHPYSLKRSPDDLYKPADPTEPEYNYCVITIDGQKLKFEMFRLNERGERGVVGHFSAADSFETAAESAKQ